VAVRRLGVAALGRHLAQHAVPLNAGAAERRAQGPQQLFNFNCNCNCCR
jgi:hypothetical protein